MLVACDESGVGEDFFVVGSAWISKEDFIAFEKKITELRL